MEGYRQEEVCRQKNKMVESVEEVVKKARYGQEVWLLDLGLERGEGQGLQQELEWIEA